MGPYQPRHTRARRSRAWPSMRPVPRHHGGRPRLPSGTVPFVLAAVVLAPT